jgi:hypothetical protein
MIIFHKIGRYREKNHVREARKSLAFSAARGGMKKLKTLFIL